MVLELRQPLSSPKEGTMNKAVGFLVAIFCVVALPAFSQQAQSITPGAGAVPQHATAQNQGQQAPVVPSALTNQDVLDMLKTGLAPKIVIAKIKSSTCQFDTSPVALKELKAVGTPDSVILAMVQAPVGKSSSDERQPSRETSATPKESRSVEAAKRGQRAQQYESSDATACKVYFSVVLLDDRVPGGFALGMDKYQSDWFHQSGKKYPGVCYVADSRDARVEYLLTYSAGERVATPAPAIYINEPQPGGGFVGGVIQGYTQTSERLPQRRKVAYLSVFRVITSGSGTRSLDPPAAIHTAERTSMSGLITRALSHPTKGVLEDGVRFLATLAARKPMQIRQTNKEVF
jgi:hypothetical protein